jgi:ribonuclease HII
MIVGIDEVGRGAWAGPMVVGAVVLGKEIPGLTDSKKLTAKKRQQLSREIRESAASIGLGWVSASKIDEIGLSAALTLATQRALAEITVDYEQIIIDGTIDFIQDSRVTTLAKADLLVPSVSAASIIAKVARDYYMATKAHKRYPDYGFAAHVGYGTAAHRAALATHGVTDIHRKSFAPIRTLLGETTKSEPASASSIDQSIGRKAEKVAASYLEDKGFEILAANWRTKICEVDIVAHKDDVTYIVEVKYRASTRSGTGLEVITRDKLRRMKRATALWQLQHPETIDIQLAAIAMTGKPPEVTDFIMQL